MTVCKFSITPEQPEHKAQIETLLDAVFGLSRRVKTSYRLREGEMPVKGLSFVALAPDRGVVGAISFWQVLVGRLGFPTLLLGPLAVAPDLQGLGIGRALIELGVQKARGLKMRLVILVGDEPYYGKSGFRKVPEDQLILPGPVDPNRLLYLELEKGALAQARGLVLPPHRFHGVRASGPPGTT